MSKKALLEEGSVRHFMKLANLKPLAEEFVTEMYDEEEEEVNEEKLEEEEETVTEADEEAVTEATNEESIEEACADEEVVSEEDAMEEPEEEPEAMGDMDDMPPPADAPAGDENEEMLRKVVDAVADVLGVDVSFGAGADEPEMDSEEEVEMEEPALDDAPGGRGYMDEEFDLDAVVAEVTKRVKERLLDTKE